MLLLAAKIALLSTGQGAPAATAESVLWAKVRNSVAVLTSNGRAVGPAVFISRDGYLVANSSLIQRYPTEVTTSNGLAYKFEVESIDPVSQLCLLKTTIPTAGVTSVQAADALDGDNGQVFAVTSNGVARAELGEGLKIGVDQKSRRSFPVQEVRVELPTLQVGGALLFSRNARLIGSLFASLPQQDPTTQNAKANYSVTGGGGIGNQANPQQQALLNNQGASRVLGPQGLVIGYTPTWEVTSKAISGFLSPTKTTQYGLLGLFVKDNAVSGVDVVTVTKGSPAEAAGIQVGDTIILIDGLAIRNQIDFSRAVYRLVPGAISQVSYQRHGKTEAPVSVTVGVASAQLTGRPKLAIESIDSLGIR